MFFWCFLLLFFPTEWQVPGQHEIWGVFLTSPVRAAVLWGVFQHSASVTGQEGVPQGLDCPKQSAMVTSRAVPGSMSRPRGHQPTLVLDRFPNAQRPYCHHPTHPGAAHQLHIHPHRGTWATTSETRHELRHMVLCLCWREAHWCIWWGRLGTICMGCTCLGGWKSSVAGELSLRESSSPWQMVALSSWCQSPWWWLWGTAPEVCSCLEKLKDFKCFLLFVGTVRISLLLSHSCTYLRNHYAFWDLNEPIER